MLAFLHWLLRVLGFGPAVAKVNSAATSTPPTLWDHSLIQTRDPEGPMTPDKAVIVLERMAYPRATVGQPPDWQVNLARATFTIAAQEYLRVLALIGVRFPKARQGEAPELFKKRLEKLAQTDLETWLAVLFGDEPVTIPAEVTDVLIQRAANSLGHDEPVVSPLAGEPDFIAYLETQSHVVQKHTDFVVFPRVIVCAEEPRVKLPNSTRTIRRETVRLSGWELRTRWCGPVDGALAIQHDEGEAEAEATSETTPKADPTVK
jgi:hypothetical protein